MSIPLTNNKRTTYTISLDELDLATFPIMNNNNNNGLLWSLNNNKLDNNYYQFSLNISEDDEMSTQSQPALSINKCYICNINIPISFKNEHLNSVKHKVCLDIANNALERIKKSFNETVSPKQQALDNLSLHYCTICSIVMKKSEKSKHESSKIHLMSVIHERMIVDFAKLYCNDDSDEYSSTTIQATENSNLMKNDTSNIVTEGVNTDITNNQYIDMLKEKFESNSFLKKVFCIGSSVQFVNNNGETVLVKESNFFGDNQEGCALCDIPQCDFKTHMFTQNHMTKLACGINSKGMRIVTSTTGHCLICNKFISNFSNMIKHQELHNMKDNRDDFMNNNGVDVKTTENKKNGNDTKKMQHTDKIQNVKASLGERLNVDNKEAFPKFDMKKYPEIEMFNNIHVKCKTCKIVVPNYEKNVIEHLNGTNHRKNASSRIKVNVSATSSTSTDQIVEEKNLNKRKAYEKHRMIQAKPGVLYCNTCLVHVPEKSVNDHMLGKNHVKNLNKLDFPDVDVPINIIFDK